MGRSGGRSRKAAWNIDWRGRLQYKKPERKENQDRGQDLVEGNEDGSEGGRKVGDRR